MFTGCERQFVIYVITCGCYTYVYMCEVAERRRPRNARAYIRPPAEHPAPHLPRKSHRQSGGDQGTPGRTSDPLQSTKSRTCHAKATGTAAETKGRRAYIRPLAVHQAPRLPLAEWQRPRDARAYIRPTWRLGGGYKHIEDILGTYGTCYLDTALTVCHLVDLQHFAHLHKWLTALT